MLCWGYVGRFRPMVGMAAQGIRALPKTVGPENTGVYSAKKGGGKCDGGEVNPLLLRYCVLSKRRLQ